MYPKVQFWDLHLFKILLGTLKVILQLETNNTLIFYADDVNFKLSANSQAELDIVSHLNIA